jgi:hypothetical protein
VIKLTDAGGRAPQLRDRTQACLTVAFRGERSSTKAAASPDHRRVAGAEAVGSWRCGYPKRADHVEVKPLFQATTGNLDAETLAPAVAPLEIAGPLRAVRSPGGWLQEAEGIFSKHGGDVVMSGGNGVVTPVFRIRRDFT